MVIREVKEADFPEWLRLRMDLYPDHSRETLQAELEAMFFNRTVEQELDYSIWVCETPEGGLSGMTEISLRPMAPQCQTSPVGYVESLNVDEAFRRAGIAHALIRKGLDWTIQKGCHEYYVDTGPEYKAAITFYKQFGFEEIARDNSEILFRMLLD